MQHALYCATQSLYGGTVVRTSFMWHNACGLGYAGITGIDAMLHKLANELHEFKICQGRGQVPPTFVKIPTCQAFFL